MPNLAYPIRKLPEEWLGADNRVYRLDPPLYPSGFADPVHYVTVCASPDCDFFDPEGPGETVVYAADADGFILSAHDLAQCMTMNHEWALDNLGYTLVEFNAHD